MAKKKGTPRKKGTTVEELRDLINRDLKTDLLRLGSGELLADVSYYVSTGWTLLDTALGGGIPAGRYVELYGKQSAGKSSLVYQIIKSCQRDGGLAIHIDMEETFPKDMAEVMGIDLDRLLVIDRGVALDGDTSIFDYTRGILGSLRERYPHPLPIVISWDTLAATPTTAEIKGEPPKNLGPYRAMTIRAGLRRLTRDLSSHQVGLVIVNHVHAQIGMGGGGQWSGPRFVTHGGMGVKFHATARISLREAAHIRDDNDMKIGRRVVAVLEKSKLSPPQRQVETHLYYGKGFDDRWSIYDYLKEQGIIKMAGAWSQLPTPDGEIVKTYQKNYITALDEHEGLFEHLKGLAIERFLNV